MTTQERMAVSEIAQGKSRTGTLRPASKYGPPTLYAPSAKGHEIGRGLMRQGYSVQYNEDPEMGRTHYVASKVPEGKAKPVEYARFRVHEDGNVEAEPVHKKHGEEGVKAIQEAMKTTGAGISVAPKASFDVGDKAIHTNKYGDKAEVNYRGSTGDGNAVVVMNGFQMTVPESELSRP